RLLEVCEGVYAPPAGITTVLFYPQPVHRRCGKLQLSYSKIDTYETCPAKFRFQYEDRVPGRPSPVLSFGDSLHQALYHFHNRPVPVAPSLAQLHDLLEAVWVRDGCENDAEARMYLHHGRQMLAQ